MALQMFEYALSSLTQTCPLQAICFRFHIASIVFLILFIGVKVQGVGRRLLSQKLEKRSVKLKA